MGKEKIVAMMFLIVVLAGVLALPQGFATKNFGNRPTPITRPTPRQSPVITHQSGSGLLGQGSDLPSNHLEGSGNVAFATPVNM